MRRRPARGRVVVTVSALLAFAALVVLLLEPSSADDPLDPESPGPSGTRALAEVLRDRGVEVDVVRSVEDLERAGTGPGTTVVLSGTDLLSPDHAQRVPRLSRRADRLVLLDMSPVTLERTGLPVVAGPGLPGGTVRSGCTGARAVTGSALVRPSDEVEAPSILYVPENGADAGSCFTVDAADVRGSALVAFGPDAGRPETVLFAGGDTLSNRYVTRGDHAGVGVRLLGASDRVVWYSPTVADLASDEEQVSPPPWLTPALTLLGVVIVLLAVQQGRRLGPLTPENLPVVVRSAETTRSRAALYRRAGDRGRAARVLRTATGARVRGRLGLTTQDPPESVVAAVVGATGGQPEEVHHLLFGPAPTDDAALVQLAHRLTALEEGARTP